MSLLVGLSQVLYLLRSRMIPVLHSTNNWILQIVFEKEKEKKAYTCSIRSIWNIIKLSVTTREAITRRFTLPT